MAQVTATYTFADGDSVAATVEVSASFPDALDEAVATCVRMFREAIAIGLEAQAEDEDEGE